ncbi:hypothetical protein IPG41_04640 [Candidatus Peregrinibacteria bacterium]|nr:MAG: hypothetical protein IPG41_04640 [Candidatus Peregrinibacteria bacterium]
MHALNRWKKLALSLALVLLINVFFNVGLETFYPAPKYDTYCPASLFQVTYETEAACTEAGGDWYAANSGGAMCDFYKSCYDEYEKVSQVYNRNAFIVLTSLGVLTLFLGLFIPKIPMAVMNGFLYGGIVSVLIGTMRYWTLMEDYLRFIVSGVALLILIVVGVKRLKD